MVSDRMSVRGAIFTILCLLAPSGVTAQTVADFSATPTTGLQALTVSFTNLSTPSFPFGRASWDFGDGATSTAWSATHTYGAPGTYTVTLEVTDLLTSSSDSVTMTDLITVNPASLVPSFDAQQVLGSDPAQVIFTDTSTGGSATAWVWNFGDGNGSIDPSPTHTYAWPGAYDVTFTAWIVSEPHVVTQTVHAKTVFLPALPSVPTGAKSMHSADVDGDDDADLARHVGNVLEVLENDGLGGFSSLSSVVDSSIRVFTFADLDGDGDPDVVTGGNGVSWYENTDGLSTFGSALPVGATAILPAHLEGADLDADGDIDLLCGLNATTIQTPVPILVWYENTDGLGSFAEHVLEVGDEGTERVAALDVNQDGALDIVALVADVGHLRWYLNDGAGGFTYGGVSSWITTGSTGLEYLEIADLEGDGDGDVLLAFGGGLWSSENLGNGLGPRTLLSPPALIGSLRGLGAADFDADGDVDAVTISRFDSFGGGFLRWYENLGDVPFGVHPIPNTFTDIDSLIALDVEGDGDVDLLVARGDSPYTLDLVENKHQWSLLGGASSSLPQPPSLRGSGALVPGSPARVDLLGAPASAPLLLWLSLSSTPFDVLAGTLHATPLSLQQFAFADAEGGLSLSLAWPVLPPGIPFWLQAIVQDLSVPDGLTLSNGLRGTTSD